MALQTGHGQMRAGQREVTETVIIARVAPCVCRMTLRTSLREIAAHVIRILRTIVISNVTVHALILSPREAVHMALRASGRDVRTRQLKLREAVIEICALPIGRVVAVCATRLECCAVVIRVCCFIRIRLMATSTSRRSGSIRRTRVTLSAAYRYV